MRSVNIAELKNSLSKYLSYAKNGEEVVIRDRETPIAKIVPLQVEDSAEDLLSLAAEGKVRLAKKKLDKRAILTRRLPRVKGNAVSDLLIRERREGR